jgi:hypothetical protein
MGTLLKLLKLHDNVPQPITHGGSEPWQRARKSRCGNAALWAAVENARLAKNGSPLRFPPPPTALGNRQLRDFHIPTAPTIFFISQRGHF